MSDLWLDMAADDLMCGFECANPVEENILGLTAAGSLGLPADIREFVSLSLLRGVEAWDQTMACAESMRRRASFDDPLEARDLLAFLAPLVVPHLDSASSRNGSPASLEDFVAREPTAKRRKAERNCREGASKGKNARQSPYWADSFRRVHQKPRTAITRCADEKQGTLPAPSSALQPVSVAHHNGSNNVPQLASAIKGCALSSPPLSPAPTHHTGDSETTQAKEAIQESKSLKGSEAVQHTKASTSSGSPKTQPESSQPLLPVSVAQQQTPKRKYKSPFFVTTPATSPKKSPSKQPATATHSASSTYGRPLRGTVSSLPFPRLDAPAFGLIQEELTHDPFRLLIAVTFLIRTAGRTAIPVFKELMAQYPSPEALAGADAAEIEVRIRHLGLGNVRAAAIQKYARGWVENPPRQGQKFVVRGYPRRVVDEEGDEGAGGEGVSPCGDFGQVQGETDQEERLTLPLVYGTRTTKTPTPANSSEWEIGHLTQGRYALDSWRIFCRDVFLGRSGDWKGEGRGKEKGEEEEAASETERYDCGNRQSECTTSEEGYFQPEWMRVLPEDKELRACLRWMWMREGWDWKPRTGDREVLSAELRRAVQERRVKWDNDGNLVIVS